MDILIGADPELFVKRNGKFHSANALIPGSKAEPFRVDNGAVQVDGMALEFNISPAKEEKEFVHNVESVLGTLREMVPREYTFDFSSVAVFDKDHMAIQPKEALELGCDADFNAYSEAQTEPPRTPRQMRAAGGHIHVGWTENEDPMESSHFLSCCQIARQLDYFLGVPSVLLDRSSKRREMYGKGGSFRPKPYGVEYRVLSNFWIKSRASMEFVFSQTRAAFDNLVKKNINFYREYGQIAKDAIDYNSPDSAKSFLLHRPQIIGEYSLEALTERGEVVR